MNNNPKSGYGSREPGRVPRNNSDPRPVGGGVQRPSANRAQSPSRGQGTPRTANGSRQTAAPNRTAAAPRQNQNVSRSGGAQTAAPTPEQIKMNAANLKREREYRKKRRSQAIKTFASRLVLYFALVLILGALTFGIFYMNLTSADTDSEARYNYSIGGSEYSLSYSNAVRDGRVYISFSDVAALCDFAVIGSPDDMTFVIKGDDTETIRFIPGSRTAYVNGIETRLGASSYYSDGEVYVPVDFVGAYMMGVNVDVNERTHEISVDRVITNLDEDGKLPKGEEAVYMDTSFLLQSAQGLKPLNEEELADVASLPDLGFATNLLIYEPYMNPGNIVDYLTVVNLDNQLSEDYAPQDLMGLVDTRDDGRTVQQLRENAAWSMEAMFKELRAAGFEDMSITSAYRPYSYQEYIFNQYLAQHNNDYDYVKTFSNPPGSSEHQLGLCADMHNLPSADISFGETEAFMWLRENCWKFGYILRYPEDKVDVTGISYEPWHYRYVGRYHAQKMYNEGLCLEEYVTKYYPELLANADLT